MSKGDGPIELKHYEKLNISVLSIAKIKDLIKTTIKNTITCWDRGLNVDKQTFHVIGPAGVGKTQICEQISNELSGELNKSFKTMIIKCPVLSRDDYLTPFPIIDQLNKEATKFKMLYSDFLPTEQDGDFGIYVIDEFSRGDHSLQQLMWQIQNEYKIHMQDLPKGWFVISIDNPDDQEYSMNMLEDAAGLRRMLHLYVEVSSADFIEHATNNLFHPSVINFIKHYPTHLYDFDAQRHGSVYANPASYERLSNILWGFEYTTGINEKSMEQIEYLSAGLINLHMTRLFMDFLSSSVHIKPEDIFYDYDEKAKSLILEYVSKRNNAKLSEMVTMFCTFLSEKMPSYTPKEMNNCADFLTDVPIDTAALFLTSIDKFKRVSPEFLYLTNLHVDMVSTSENYKSNFYDYIKNKLRK